MKIGTNNFDLYALANPKSRADVLALASEALAEMKSINSHLSAAIARCEAEEAATA